MNRSYVHLQQTALAWDESRLRTPCPPVGRTTGGTEAAALHRALVALFFSNALVGEVSTSPSLRALLTEQGLDPSKVAVVEIRSQSSSAGDKAAVVVAVPDDLGVQEPAKLGALVASVRASGKRCRVLRRSTVLRQPRLANRRLLAAHGIRTSTTPVKIHVLGRIAEHTRVVRDVRYYGKKLRSEPTIGQVARGLTCGDPIGAVLALAAHGVIRIDMRRPITHESTVRKTLRGRHLELEAGRDHVLHAWKTLPPEFVDDGLASEIRGVTEERMSVAHPGWRAASRGDTAAAVRVAIDLVKLGKTASTAFDLAMSVLLVHARDGDPTARLVLDHQVRKLRLSHDEIDPRAFSDETAAGHSTAS